MDVAHVPMGVLQRLVAVIMCVRFAVVWSITAATSRRTPRTNTGMGSDRTDVRSSECTGTSFPCQSRAVQAVDGDEPSREGPTIVLVHGSGHTAAVWGEVQEHLRHPSLAVDLPGRADRVADIADVAIEDAAAALTADLDAGGEGPVVLVGHSAGGIVLPALAARLGDRVVHLVFVAGLSAKHGETVMATVRPDAEAFLTERLVALREEFAGCMLEPVPSIDGVRALDAKTAAPLDSLNYMEQVMSWAGVPDDLPRTFVRCLRDKIQPRQLQDELIANCGATEVIDLESGHTPAVAVPVELAAILDRIAAR
jgi:pimeloyl-ACP methyl ester carboxylesterase